MSVQRVTTRTPGAWATPDRLCFRCGNSLIAGHLVIAWMSCDGSGIHYWHLDCAPEWGAAFMRDVWEIGHADRHPDADEPARYDEPEGQAVQ